MKVKVIYGNFAGIPNGTIFTEEYCPYAKRNGKMVTVRVTLRKVCNWQCKIVSREIVT